MTATMQKRVNDGANWLDENYPGWFGRINLRELNMKDRRYCVLGQVTGGVNEYIRIVFDGIKDVNWDEQHGFDICYNESYDNLTMLWLTEIANRKEVK